MKAKLVFFLMALFAFSSSVFSQAPPLDTSTVSFLNCPTNGIGNNSSNSKARGQTIDTRRGNNGKGNGGESFDVYVTVGISGSTETIVECIRTADEDTYGTQYLKLPGQLDYVAIGTTRELDPNSL